MAERMEWSGQQSVDMATVVMRTDDTVCSSDVSHVLSMVVKSTH